jgi:hypothetical protein
MRIDEALRGEYLCLIKRRQRGDSMRKAILVAMLVSAALVLAPAAALASDANGNHGSYLFHIGLGPSGMGAPASAGDGSTIFVTGDGTFQAPNGSAAGGGTYTLENSAGTIVGSGSWTVDSIQNFVFYGVTPSGIVAGEAKLKVHLTGGPLAGDDGTLTIWCVAGGLAPPGKSEGIALVLGQGGAFTHSGFGPNFFKAV